MQRLLLILTLSLWSSSAIADIPQSPKPPADPPSYSVHLTAQDLNVMAVAFARVGERCSPQDETACQAQLAADALVKRLQTEMSAQEKSPPKSPK